MTNTQTFNFVSAHLFGHGSCSVECGRARKPEKNNFQFEFSKEPNCNKQNYLITKF
jgi:hypothetical protein